MEKVIGGLEEIELLEVSAIDGRADVTLTHPVELLRSHRPRGDARVRRFSRRGGMIGFRPAVAARSGRG